jgi:hypothetical protein
MRPKTPIGAKRMTPPVSFIITWKPASKNPSRRLRCPSPTEAMLMPKRIEKKITASMSASAADLMTLAGTMSSSSSMGELGVSRSGTVAVSAPVMLAPTPGLTRLTATSPTIAARALDSR